MTNRKVSALVLLGTFVIPTVYAQFPIPIPGLGIMTVYDPFQAANMGTAIKQAIEDYQVYLQLRTLAEGTYNQVVFNATHLGAERANAGAVLSQIQNAMAQSKFGELTGYNDAVNNGGDPTIPWTTGTTLSQPSPYWANIPMDGTSDLLANLATVDLANGIAPPAIAAIGASRVSQTLNQTAYASLLQMINDPSDDANAAVKQANIANVSAGFQAGVAMDSNNLVRHMLELGLVQAKQAQDAANSQTMLYSGRDNFVATEVIHYGNTVQSVTNW